MASATVEPKVTLATTASIPEDAWLAFFMAGYDIRSPEAIMRKGDEASGNGFWDITVEGRRLVRYGSGEYVLPHKHSEIELFAIQCGSATVWLWTNQRWNRNTVKEGDQLVIGPHVPHCLVAGDTGLIMHTVLDDSTRTIDWLPDYPIPWYTGFYVSPAMTLAESRHLKHICLHKEKVPCTHEKCTHLALFTTPHTPYKLLLEVIRDIEVCATFVQPLQKTALINPETGGCYSKLDWLKYAQSKIVEQWVANCAPNVCTTSVASVISTRNILAEYPLDADPWTFIATAKDRDTVCIGKAEAQYRASGDTFVVLQSRVHVTREEIIECFEQANNSIDVKDGDEPVSDLKVLHKVVTLLICAAERGAANRLHRNACALGFAVEEDESDIYARSIMPFASCEAIRAFGLHLMPPKTIRCARDGLLEKYDWKRCTITIHNNLRQVLTPSEEHVMGLFMNGLDLGTEWAREGLHVQVHGDEGAVVRANNLHGGLTHKWPFVACAHFLRDRLQGVEAVFRDILATLHCIHVDKRSLKICEP